MFYFASIASTSEYFWFAWLATFVVVELHYFLGKHNPGLVNDGTFSAMVWRFRDQNKLVYALLVMFWLMLGYHFFLWQP